MIKVVARKKAKLEVSTKRKVRIDRRYRDRKRLERGRAKKRESTDRKRQWNDEFLHIFRIISGKVGQ